MEQKAAKSAKNDFKGRRTTRTELYQSFIAEYSYPAVTKVAAAQDVSMIESELRTVLPESYVSFVQSHGAPFTPDILDLIVDSGRDTPNVREFFTVEEAICDSRLYWSGGMSSELIGFASDCMGNMFCFRRRATGPPRPDDAEVWFFDHDDCAERKLAETFDEWIRSFVDLKRPDPAASS